MCDFIALTQYCKLISFLHLICSKSRYYSYPLISRPPKKSKFGKFLDLEIFARFRL